HPQQKKCIKDPVEIHHIKQKEEESTKDFMQNIKTKSRNVKGAPECMRIFGFMHGITNSELINCMHDNILKSMDEMMRVTTMFLRGVVAASNQARKKTLLAWRQQEAGRKQNFDRKGDFKNQQRLKRRDDKFTLLIKSPKEILALDKAKFKTPPPMTTPMEKRISNKFCEFYEEVGRKQLSHKLRVLKQRSGKDQPKAAKNGEMSRKDKAMAIMMVQPWQKVARQSITQSFSPDLEILFVPLGDKDGTKGPVIIEAEIGGHFVHRIYVDRGSASEILYEHCYNRLRPKIKNQMVPATAPLIGFSREIIWPIGRILLPVRIEDAEHSTSTWMNSVVVRSPSPYNKIIGRPGTAKERIRVAIHPEYPEQTIAIGSTLTEE
ncbi:hypothetical protein Tco_1206126, partial [Tanacetum coccineum]